MTEAQFVKNHRGVDQGMDPPKALLEGMYRRVKVSPLAEFFFVLDSCWPTRPYRLCLILCVFALPLDVLSLPPTHLVVAPCSFNAMEHSAESLSSSIT